MPNLGRVDLVFRNGVGRDRARYRRHYEPSSSFCSGITINKSHLQFFYRYATKFFS